VERRVEAGDLRQRGRAFEQAHHGRQAVRLVEGRQRDETLESLERLVRHSHRRRELESSVHDTVSDCHQSVMREVPPQEVPEIFDRTLRQ
jgi:hypothetical protein